MHHSPDHRVIGASDLSLSLDVSNFRVRKIKENLANRVLALRNVFIPLSEPLSVMALTDTEGTSAVVAIPAGTTMALSVTFASTSVVRPISTDDYEIVHVDGQRGESAEDQIGGDNVDPFPNVDNVDLNLQYVVPTGRVIATDSVIVATSGYVVPAAYDIRPGRV
ncbi:hypothetical protein Tco_0641295, partial [Tanacetum coccineum]